MDLNLHWSDRSKGIYCIQNKITKDFYIGSTINTFYNRYRNHVSSLKRNKNSSKILQNAVNKYGIDNFSFSVLKTLIDDNEIIRTEDLLIKIYDPKYNICKHVRHGGKPNLGRKLSKEWKEKIKKKSLQYSHSEEVLKKVTRNNKNNACEVIFYNNEEEIVFQSWKQASIFFDTTSSNIQNSYRRHKAYKAYKIKKLSKQSNAVRLYLSKDEYRDFDSMNACDRYLGLWRGATSTAILTDNLLQGYYVKTI